MNGTETKSKVQWRSFFRPASLPAIVGLVVVILGTSNAEFQNARYYQQQQKSEILDKISLIRSRLEGNINANMQLVRGLVSLISVEPDIGQTRFTAIARHLYSSPNQLRNIAAAPDMVISLVYPIEGNEEAIGLDYNRNDDQRAAALRARDSGQLLVAGPVDLVQGGTGFVGRFPVFVRQSDGSRDFWGIVSAVVDAERLYADSGVSAGLPFELAIRGRDSTGPEGSHFFGPEEIYGQDPVVAEVRLPSGSWQLSAAPKGGWSTTPDNLWIIRSAGFIAALLIVVPALITGRLMEERNLHLRRFRQGQTELERLSRRLEVALSASQIGVWELDVTNDELIWDNRMREIYGIEKDAPVGHQEWISRLHPDDAERAVDEFNYALEHGSPYNSQFRVCPGDGVVRTVRTMGSIDGDAATGLRIVGVNWDVSEDVALNAQLRAANAESEARNAALEAAKARIEHNSLHDSLTELPNRRFLDELLAGQHQGPAWRGKSLSLLHVDLDRFKQINDTLGHSAGDAMLIHAAGVLRNNVRAQDFVARIGGDEFVIVCVDKTSEAALSKLADRIVRKMHEPVDIQGHECRVGVSIGIAIGSPDMADATQLLINADIALYRAKNAGRNNFQFYTDGLHQAAIQTKRLADEIIAGMERDEFIPHYQGQFQADTLELAGVEALVRWQHPEHGLMPPGYFLEVAEDLNVVAAIDHRILEKSLAQMRKWRRGGIDVPRVSVNVSSRRLHDPDLIDSLKTLDLKAGAIAFELVESIFLDDQTDQVTWNIEQIKKLGIEIEVDDFGTGYSSIISLMQLRPKRLKIDQKLITPITASANQREMVRSIVNIGRALDIESVGEGVESMEHARVARALGCTILQGFGLARPMDGADFGKFVRSGAWRDVA